MKDEELLEWYKNNSGSKPADMSEKEYELNMNKAIKLKQNQALDQNLASQQSNIKRAQTNAQQSASISNEKLMKYLGQAQLSSGIAKGQTGSDFINANNNYVQNRATITNNAVAQQNELLNEYTKNKLTNETQAYNNEISILDKYKQQAIDEENRRLQQEKWQLEKDQLLKDDKNIIKAEQTSDDIAWLEAANERINKMYSMLMDDEGNLSDNAKAKIEAELMTYKDKFNSEEYYERLLDVYKTLIYDGNQK